MIAFPKLHIATSVLNRIMNTLDDKASPLNIMPAPVIPDSTMLGLQIDEQASAPLEPVQELAPEAPETPALEQSLLGGSLFDGAMLS